MVVISLSLEKSGICHPHRKVRLVVVLLVQDGFAVFGLDDNIVQRLVVHTYGETTSGTPLCVLYAAFRFVHGIVVFITSERIKFLVIASQFL